MELVERGGGLFRSPPAPNTPIVEVLFGGDDGGPDVGFARIEVPPGAGMPEHRHSGSDVVILALEGGVEVTEGGETIAVGPGDALLIGKDEAVALSNPGPAVARLLVAAGPPTFLAGIRAWPEPTQV